MNTVNLGLSLIVPEQSQKHVPVNESLSRLDAIVQLSVKRRDLAVPPEAQDGDRYIVAVGASGAWSGQTGKVAVSRSGGWFFISPLPGWVFWIENEALLLVWDGAAFRESASYRVGEAVRFSTDAMVLAGTSPNSVYFNLANALPGAHGGYTFFSSGGGPAPIGSFGIYDQTYGARLFIDPNGNLTPGADNAFSLGTGGQRWSAVWAANGTIQTSDTRDKIEQATLPGETAVALLDAIEAITFQWRIGGWDIQPLEPQPDGALQPVKASERPGTRRHAGFRAQDVRAALDALGEDFAVWGMENLGDPDSRQWLRPDQLIPVLWSAVRETRRELADLRATVEAFTKNPD